MIVYFISAVISLVLPLDVVMKGPNVEIAGLSATFSYTIFGIIYILLVLLLIIARKTILTKKYIPIVLFVGDGVLLYVIQMWVANLNYLINPIVVITCLIMYFTIENPDIKLIEELSKSRELSEKYNNDKSNFIFNMTQQIRYC